jgi:hypothetical protein
MMQATKKENQFWAEAMATLCYLQNITPTKAVIKKTLWEIWYLKKLVYIHLGIFESRGFAKIPNEQKKKLDVKSRECIFIGYGDQTKEYKLFDPLKGPKN